MGLWSEKKTFKETHYRDLHPTNPDNDFIKVNGMNCVWASQTSADASTNYHAGTGTFVTMIGLGIKSRTTLKVEKKSRYSNMQPGIDGTISQNEAIARQNECHPGTL